MTGRTTLQARCGCVAGGWRPAPRLRLVVRIPGIDARADSGSARRLPANEASMMTLTRLLGSSLIASILLVGCANDPAPIRREEMPMEPAPLPPDPKCAVGRSFPCFCMPAGKGTQQCLETGALTACACGAAAQPPGQVECQPGSRVVCMCPSGGTGNHLCRPDSTFEPCSMCIGGDPGGDAG